MKKRKLLSMLIAIILLIKVNVAGYATAAAESPYYGLKLHYVVENHDFIDVGIITIQVNQFPMDRAQLEHDKLSDVIADVQINPIDEVSILSSHRIGRSSSCEDSTLAIC